MNTHRASILLACSLLLASCGDDETSSSPGSPDAGVPDAQQVGDSSTDTVAPDAVPDVAPDAAGPHQQQVEELAAPLIDDGWTPAMIVGLAGPDGVEYYSFGATDEGMAPAPDTVFEIGSVSKTFTSLVLADLVQDGSVTLAQPVNELLPPEVDVPARNGTDISLRHLSTHHSGLPRMPSNFVPADVSDPYVDYTTQDLYDFLNAHELAREPGASFEYSNLGTGLLGHALTLETGNSYEAMVRARVLEPLSLDDTGIELDAEQQTRLIQGHDADGRPVSPWTFDVLAPAGALRSTATDMIAYVAAHTGLTSSSLDAAMAATHEKQYDIATNTGIGLAWLIDEDRYRWHNGGTGGFGTFVGFDKQTSTGVVVLSNAYGIYMPETELGKALLRMMAGESYDPLDLPPNLDLSASELEPFTGTFDATVQGQSFSTYFSVEGGYLYANLPGNPPLKLYPMAEAKFYMRVAPVWVTFEGSGGSYDAFTLEQQGGATVTGTRAE